MYSETNVMRNQNRPIFERSFHNIPCEENYWVATRGGSELSILKLFHFLDLFCIGMDLLFAKALIVPYPLKIFRKISSFFLVFFLVALEISTYLG